MSDEAKAMVITLKGPRGEYDLIQSLRRAKVQNMTGACFTDAAADMIEAMASDLKERDSRIETYDKLVAKQEADIERLRGALSRIQRCAFDYSAEEISEAAYAALSGDSDGEKG